MINEDLNVYFNSTDAEAATITGVAGSVYGFFERQFVEITSGRTPVVGYKPTFTCQYSDVSAVARGTSVSIEGQTETFSVALIQPADASGVCLIILEES